MLMENNNTFGIYVYKLNERFQPKLLKHSFKLIKKFLLYFQTDE